MNDVATLSHRRRLRFWGWGYADEQLTPEEEARIRAGAARAIGHPPAEGPDPIEADFDLRPPRVAPPPALAKLISVTPYDRLTHALGKSFGDVVRMRLRQVPHPPDLVAFPRNQQDVSDLLDWASRANVAAIPFGGGSSVAGGIEPGRWSSISSTSIACSRSTARAAPPASKLARLGPRSRTSCGRTA